MAGSMTSDIIQQFTSPSGNFSVVLEQDDRVGYAYLLRDEDVVADVWLFNVAPTPSVPPWKVSPNERPFLNPSEFAEERKIIFINNERIIRCEWMTEGVEVYVGEKMVARLLVGSKPGWSLLAKKDGPLARRLSQNDG